VFVVVVVVVIGVVVGVVLLRNETKHNTTNNHKQKQSNHIQNRWNSFSAYGRRYCGGGDFRGATNVKGVACVVEGFCYDSEAEEESVERIASENERVIVGECVFAD